MDSAVAAAEEVVVAVAVDYEQDLVDDLVALYDAGHDEPEAGLKDLLLPDWCSYIIEYYMAQAYTIR